MPKRKNWSAIMKRLNDSPKGSITIQMGSPGSAQVTRVRLLEEWSNVDVRTVGAKLYIQIRR